MPNVVGASRSTSGSKRPPKSKTFDPVAPQTEATTMPKMKQRPLSATEPRELEKAHKDNLRSSGSLSKVTVDRQCQVSFAPVYPSNAKKPAKSTNSPAGNPALDSRMPFLAGGCARAFTTMGTASRPVKSQVRRPPLSQPRTNSERSASAGSAKAVPSKSPARKPQNLIVPLPNLSVLTKAPAQSLANKNRGTNNISNNTKPVVKTQVVLAPRFGPDSEPSILGIAPGESQHNFLSGDSRAASGENPKATGSSKNASSSNLNPMADFPPAKAQWVKMALAKLGKAWVASGAVPQYIMDFPEFQKKIGDLYDMAVDRKFNQIKSAQAGDTVGVREPKSTSARRSKSKVKDKRDKPEAPDSIPDDVQKKISDIILQLLLTKLMPPSTGDFQGTNSQSSNVNPSLFSEEDDSAAGMQETGGRREISKCYISDGKICPVKASEVQDKTHSFLSTGESRKRTEPDAKGYFRRIADFRGFEADEVKFKYTKTRVFVEGRHPLRGEKNARQVREIIALPKSLGIEDLKVMRGKKGLLVFEQISNPKAAK